MELGIYAIALLVLIFLGTPIGYSILISTVLYVVAFSDQNLLIVCKQILQGANSFSVLALPFYLLLGNLLGCSGIIDRMIRLANGMVGHMRGSLAQVNNISSMLLACVQGVATSGTAATGSVLIPAMKKEGYPAGYAAALTAAAATIGPIIPPSITFVTYGVAAEVSVAKLFLSGVIPGLVLGVFLMVYAGIKARHNPAYAGSATPFSVKRLWEGVKAGILTMLIPIIILGGILGGIFTATESGAFAVLTAIFLGLFVFRSMKLRDIWTAVKSTCETLGNFAIIFAAAHAFSWMLTREGAAQLLSNALLSLTQNGVIVMLLMNVVLLIAGCFMDTLSNVILFTPIFLPIAVAYGYDPIHFGAIMVINLTFGTITPPLGTSMFMACGIAEVKMETFVKEIIPIYVPMILLLLLVIFIPQITMCLPNLMMH